MFSKFRVSLQNAWRAGFRRHLLVTNTVLCGAFYLLGDAIEQRREITLNPGRRFDFERNLRLGVVGLIQGPPHHYWYIYLDNFFPRTEICSILLEWALHLAQDLTQAHHLHLEIRGIQEMKLLNRLIYKVPTF